MDESLAYGDFSKIAQNGFGDTHNNYAWSMAWFKGKLYVGTLRDMLVLYWYGMTLPPFDPYPVEIPPSQFYPDLDLRAEIWCYTPGTGIWEMVYQSPLIDINTPDGLKQTARYAGYRGMGVFTESDGTEALYVASLAVVGSAILLRTTDGVNFEQASMPGLIPGIEPGVVLSYRSLVSYKDKLFTALNGADFEEYPELQTVYMSEHPEIGVWQAASLPNFGGGVNGTVSEITVFNGYLYASAMTLNGFYIWKTDATGDPPYDWTPVIVDGAYRGELNMAVASMTVFKDKLYVGGGILPGGYNLEYDIGPAAAEIIRINPDDSWELICGSERYTPDGIKIPISGMGPGFDNPFNGYFWRIAEYDDWLYVGTFDNSVMTQYLALDDLPPNLAAIVEKIGVESIINMYGGFDLWKTSDGISWYPITTRGFGNPYNYGVRGLIPTPDGLFLGTANPFTEAVDEYGNPIGGCEIWAGEYQNGNILRVPSVYTTIQSAINVASDGDRVLVADGIYKGDGNKNLDFGGKAITVQSENGAALTIIDCENDGRGFSFTTQEDRSSVVRGFTIQNGSAANGAGIFISGASPSIEYNIIRWNNAFENGGAICCKNSIASIMNNTVTENTAINGGGIHNEWYPQVLNTILWNNTPNEVFSTTTIPIIYSDIQGGWPGKGNIDADPLFVNPLNGDYLPSDGNRYSMD